MNIDPTKRPVNGEGQPVPTQGTLADQSVVRLPTRQNSLPKQIISQIPTKIPGKAKSLKGRVSNGPIEDSPLQRKESSKLDP